MYPLTASKGLNVAWSDGGADGFPKLGLLKFAVTLGFCSDLICIHVCGSPVVQG